MTPTIDRSPGIALPTVTFPPGWQIRVAGGVHAEHPELGAVRVDPGPRFLERLAEACAAARREIANG